MSDRAYTAFKELQAEWREEEERKAWAARTTDTRETSTAAPEEGPTKKEMAKKKFLRKRR